MKYEQVFINCNANIFQKRFNAENKIFKQYNPLFLAITYSYDGSLAPSFGLFEKNGELYTVFGEECSVFDFNGQFEPEITTIDILELSIKKNRMDHISGDKYYNQLVDYINYLKQTNTFKPIKFNEHVKTEIDFYSSKELTSKSPIEFKQLDIFKNNLFHGDRYNFYFFNIKTDWNENITIYITEQNIMLVNSKNCFLTDSCIQKFLNDLEGAIELKQANFFIPEEHSKLKKVKP